MSWLSEFFCSGLKRSLASILPWDIPWYDASHVVFFVALYGALAVIGLGLAVALMLTLKQMQEKDSGAHH
jgi:hypothetical protein